MKRINSMDTCLNLDTSQNDYIKPKDQTQNAFCVHILHSFPWDESQLLRTSHLVFFLSCRMEFPGGMGAGWAVGEHVPTDAFPQEAHLASCP